MKVEKKSLVEIVRRCSLHRIRNLSVPQSNSGRAQCNGAACCTCPAIIIGKKKVKKWANKVSYNEDPVKICIRHIQHGNSIKCRTQSHEWKKKRSLLCPWPGVHLRACWILHPLRPRPVPVRNRCGCLRDAKVGRTVKEKSEFWPSNSYHLVKTNYYWN